MAYVVDYSGESAYVDGVETVTFTPRNPSGTPVATAKGLRATLSKNAAMTFAGIVAFPSDVVFTLYHDTLNSNVPKEKDTITDASGGVFIILSVQLLADNSQSVCLTRKAPT